MQERAHRILVTLLLGSISRILAASLFGVFCLDVGAAISAPLVPNTKIRLTIIQWMPTKGTYQQWETVGGEYTISENDTISVPLLGAISVADKDEVTLGLEIAKQLKEKIGLVDEPTASIEIVSYPRIYVVGDVTKPGEYDFHSGITVLQALAKSGGEFRHAVDPVQNSQTITRLVGELQEIDDAIVRTGARIDRLEAEMTGEKTIHPKEDRPKGDPFSSAIYNQEEVIFSARANELARQSSSLTGLRDLLTDEVNVLQEKIKSTDANINSAQQQLNSTIALIERGALVATRQADAERTMRNFQNERLDLTVSIMKARQDITEATRDLEGLYDRRQTEVASELQSERANMTQLKVKRATSQKLLVDTLSSNGPMNQDEKPLLQFTIVRRGPGTSSTELTVQETTAMLPGDVLKVAQPKPARTPNEAMAIGVGQ